MASNETGARLTGAELGNQALDICYRLIKYYLHLLSCSVVRSIVILTLSH